MQEIKPPIGIGKNVIVTDQGGRSREGKVINHDKTKYVIRFPDTIMSEFWSSGFVKEK